MDPLISIIVPVYNVQDKLKFCISSITGQTYQNLQIILVDDGSEDESGKICDELAAEDERIQVIHMANKGVSAARNAGLKIAEGEYIGFVDSDDWINPNMYEYLLRLLIEHDADVSSAAIVRTEQENDSCPETEEHITVYTRDEYAKKFFKIGSQEIVYYIWNRLYRRNVVSDDIFPCGIAIGEDVLVTYRVLLKAGTVVESNMPMYFYRLSSGITSRFGEKYFQLTDVWNEVGRLAAEHGGQDPEYARINQARISFTILSELAIAGEYKNPQYADRRDALLADLKKNKKFLLESDISSSRKLMIKWFCSNYGSAAFLMSKFMKRRQ